MYRWCKYKQNMCVSASFHFDMLVKNVIYKMIKNIQYLPFASSKCKDKRILSTNTFFHFTFETINIILRTWIFSSFSRLSTVFRCLIWEGKHFCFLLIMEHIVLVIPLGSLHHKLNIISQNIYKIVHLIVLD